MRKICARKKVCHQGHNKHMHKRKPIVLLKQTNVQKEPKPLSFTKRIQDIQRWCYLHCTRVESTSRNFVGVVSINSWAQIVSLRCEKFQHQYWTPCSQFCCVPLCFFISTICTFCYMHFCIDFAYVIDVHFHFFKEKKFTYDLSIKHLKLPQSFLFLFFFKLDIFIKPNKIKRFQQIKITIGQRACKEVPLKMLLHISKTLNFGKPINQF